MCESMGKRVSVLAKSFTWPPDEPALIGSRCLACATWAFPRTFLCPNPECADRSVEDARLSRSGRLASWTVVHFPPPPPYVPPDPFQPFAIGEVEFPEGIQVIGPLVEYDFGRLAIGMSMETVVEPYYINVEGIEVVGWKFRVVAAVPTS